MSDAPAPATGGIFSRPDVVATARADGSTLLTSRVPLGHYPPTVLHGFHSWVEVDGGHVLARERTPSGTWRNLTYAEADQMARSVGQALLERGLGPERPLLILSENSLDHLVVLLGAMTAGVPVAPTSVAYSLQSRDHARLREVAAVLEPGAVFAADAGRYAAALDALPGVPSLVSTHGRAGAATLADLVATAPGREVEEALAGLSAGTVAKVLFTSGSTGSPKGVLTTHGMLSSNQQAIRQVWPFLASERPAIVDWLPWSHTFGGSHNLDMMLTCGGTLTIDGGRPVAGLVDQTLRNLREAPPTIYFNVPAGYAHLVPALESDTELATRFFSRLRLLFNAAAALPEALRARLQDVAVRTVGHPVPFTGSWGLTETAPAVTNAHYDFDDARNIGVPLPGAEVLLVPAEEDYEIRVRGPMVTPGYLDRPDLTADSFDAEGFYRTGDAVRRADPEDPNAGLLFVGRLVEDFKLDTGTFVRVGAVRTALLSAVPLLADAVIAGENQSSVAALAWVNPAEAHALLGRAPAVDGEAVDDPELTEAVGRALDRHAATTYAAGRVTRVLLMSRPADLDAGEVTDKGYVNQRRVLALRRHLVDRLYAEPPPPAVVLARPVSQL